MNYLFSYGSNSTKQLYRRVNPSNFLEPIPAYIDNYCRIFAGYSYLWKGGIASIHPCPGNRVYGSLVQLTDRELEKLDIYETGYKRVKIYVINQFTNNAVLAYVYIKSSTAFTHYPSEFYLKEILYQLHETTRNHTNSITIRGINERNKIHNYGEWNSLDGIIKY